LEIRKFEILLLRAAIFFCICCCFQKYSAANIHDSIGIKLSLDKNVYFPNEDILLKIEFEMKHVKSIVYFSHVDFSRFIVLIDEQNNIYRPKDYLLTLSIYDSVKNTERGGRIVFPVDSVQINQKKIINLELNNDFTLEENYWYENLKIKKYLNPGKYKIKYENPAFFYLIDEMLWMYGNELNFEILKKEN